MTEGAGNPRLALLMAMAMFVLVVGTSLAGFVHLHVRRKREGNPTLIDPIHAGLLGLFNSFRTMRLPDPAPSRPSKRRSWG